MLTRTDAHDTIAQRWLDQFEIALATRDDRELKDLFHPDSHWRDILAFTWTIGTVNGRDAILSHLLPCLERIAPRGFSTEHDRTSPRIVQRAGVSTLEVIFRFATAIGQCWGVIRLTEEAKEPGRYKAWTLLTALDDLSGHFRHTQGSRTSSQNYVRDFRGPNWLDNRRSTQSYKDRDPTVVVVGAGQAGLSVAAHLTQLQVDTLVVDKETRIGDNWRKRYHALTLHNQTHVNHLPFMSFPPNWPAYIPKDKLANWFEAYAESMELNCWTGTEFQSAHYDATVSRWNVILRRDDGSQREMRPRHVIMATGVSGIPNWPDIPSLGQFCGTTIHSSQYTDGENWRRKKAIVLGTGSSGHDIAQDLHSAGAEVTLVQRSPTMVVNIEPSAQLPYALYDEGPSVDDCDLIATSMPLSLLRRSHIEFTRRASTIDKPLLDDLERRGFKLDFGEDGTGWQFKYLTRGGGYYFNVGCSDLIASGKIRLIQWRAVKEFTAEGARLTSGENLGADLVVLATGYKGQELPLKKLFGKDVVDKVGPIWGFGDNDELRGMYTKTGQRGLWFIAGSLAQCRIYSKYLALQIKAYDHRLTPI